MTTYCLCCGRSRPSAVTAAAWLAGGFVARTLARWAHCAACAAGSGSTISCNDRLNACFVVRFN